MIVGETSAVHRRQHETQHLGLGLLGIAVADQLEAGLAELVGVGGVGAVRLEAERGAVVAVARGGIGVRVAREIEAAGRHREIGAQAQLRAFGIGEHVGARAQVLADHVEEHVGRLDDGRRHGLAAGRGEHGHQPQRLALQRLELSCGFSGHVAQIVNRRLG